MSTVQVANLNFESTANNQLIYLSNTLTIRTGGATLAVINSTSINAVSNTFNLGTSTKTANGYSYLPNGLLLQWGIVVLATGAQASFNYPIAFPTAALSVSLTTPPGVAVGHAGISTTSAFVANASAAATSYFMAIGY
jgi:hypothetical protein